MPSLDQLISDFKEDTKLIQDMPQVKLDKPKVQMDQKAEKDLIGAVFGRDVEDPNIADPAGEVNMDWAPQEEDEKKRTDELKNAMARLHATFDMARPEIPEQQEGVSSLDSIEAMAQQVEQEMGATGLDPWAGPTDTAPEIFGQELIEEHDIDDPVQALEGIKIALMRSVSPFLMDKEDVIRPRDIDGLVSEIIAGIGSDIVVTSALMAGAAAAAPAIGVSAGVGAITAALVSILNRGLGNEYMYSEATGKDFSPWRAAVSTGVEAVPIMKFGKGWHKAATQLAASGIEAWNQDLLLDDEGNMNKMTALMVGLSAALSGATNRAGLIDITRKARKNNAVFLVGNALTTTPPNEPQPVTSNKLGTQLAEVLDDTTVRKLDDYTRQVPDQFFEVPGDFKRMLWGTGEGLDFGVPEEIKTMKDLRTRTGYVVSRVKGLQRNELPEHWIMHVKSGEGKKRLSDEQVIEQVYNHINSQKRKFITFRFGKNDDGTANLDGFVDYYRQRDPGKLRTDWAKFQEQEAMKFYLSHKDEGALIRDAVGNTPTGGWRDAQMVARAMDKKTGITTATEAVLEMSRGIEQTNLMAGIMTRRLRQVEKELRKSGINTRMLRYLVEEDHGIGIENLLNFGGKIRKGAKTFRDQLDEDQIKALEKYEGFVEWMRQEFNTQTLKDAPDNIKRYIKKIQFGERLTTGEKSALTRFLNKEDLSVTDLIGERRLNIAKRDDYFTNTPADKSEVVSRLREALRSADPDKQKIARRTIRGMARDSGVADNTSTAIKWLDDYVKADAQQSRNMLVPKYGLMRKNQMGEMQKEHDLLKAGTKYISQMSRALNMEKGVNKVYENLAILNGLDAGTGRFKKEIEYLQNYLESVSGNKSSVWATSKAAFTTRYKNFFNKWIENYNVEKGIKEMQEKVPAGSLLTERMREAQLRTQKDIAEVAKKIPDVLGWVSSLMYPNLLGWNIRAPLRNLTQTWLLTAPEIGMDLGYGYGTAVTAKAWTQATAHARSGGIRGVQEFLDSKGWRAGRFYEEGSKIIAKELVDTPGIKQGIQAVDALSRWGMWLYGTSDDINRYVTYHTAKLLTSRALSGDEQAAKIFTKLGPQWAQRFKKHVNAQDMDGLTDALADYMIGKTQFIYNKAGLSQWGRDYGAIISAFQKWPLMVAGDIEELVRDRRFGDIAIKHLTPLLVFGVLGAGMEQMGVFENPVARKAFGKGLGNITAYSPMLAPLQYGWGPQVDLISGAWNATAVLLKEHKLEKAGKELKKAVEPYIPLKKAIKEITDWSSK